MKRIEQVLLIDDSKATNFFNEKILNKSEYVEEIYIATNGKEALEQIVFGDFPEIIFLDINMPVMNGWEFLSEFNKLENNIHTLIVLMIGTKLGSEDEILLSKYPEVLVYQEKMLSEEFINTMVAKYCSQKFDVVK